jgi:hypothetical protein
MARVGRNFDHVGSCFELHAVSVDTALSKQDREELLDG